MINIIWFILLISSIVFGVFTGNGDIISKSIVNSTYSTVELMIKLVGMMCLWCGVMRIAQKSGLTDKLAKLLKPILKKLFKTAGQDEKALGDIIMNLTANMMGLSNAATPFGIKAMEDMQRLNPHKDTASNDMALFLVLNAACIQIVPTSVISIRAAANSQNPACTMIAGTIATGTAAIVGCICCKILERYF